MDGRRRRRIVALSLVADLVALLLVATLVAADRHPSDAAVRGHGIPSISSSPGVTISVVAAGDICSPNPDSCMPTSDLALSLDPDAVLTLGDNQYPDGALDDYQRGYDPAWGRLRDITFPVAGNHEWHQSGAQGFLDYFGLDRTWYTFTIGSWRFYALDASCDDNGGCGPGSPQYEWLRTELASRSDPCILAYWHQPRFSSGTNHGSDDRLDPFWRLLWSARADLILGGHEHNYERFAPQDPDAQPASTGIVEIVAGTGGASDGRYPFGDPIENSVLRLNGTGVVEFSLGTTGWSESFVRPTGEVVDRSTGIC
jgi:hypothetical protein